MARRDEILQAIYEADRLHPVKRSRPIAAGLLSPTTARVIAVVLILVAGAITAPINDGKLTSVVAAYVAVTLSYTIWLKHEPVIDLVAVAAGFVFRAIAGPWGRSWRTTRAPNDSASAAEWSVEPSSTTISS